MKESYVVVVNRPKGVSVSEMKQHIKDAVDCWGGQLHPDNPLFEQMNAKVKRINSDKPKQPDWEILEKGNLV